MDGGLRIGAADRSITGPAHASCPHPGEERGKLPPQRQQATPPREASLLVTGCFTAPICRVGFRSGLSAPRKAGRRPTLQPPPQIPQSKASTASEVVYFLSAQVVYFYSALDSKAITCLRRSSDDQARATTRGRWKGWSATRGETSWCRVRDSPPGTSSTLTCWFNR